MALPQTGKKAKPLPPDDPMNLALRQLQEYEEGTQKRTVKDYGNCCPCDDQQRLAKEERECHESATESRKC